ASTATRSSPNWAMTPLPSRRCARPERFDDDEAALVAQVALCTQGNDLRGRTRLAAAARARPLRGRHAEAERTLDAGQPAFEDPHAGAGQRLRVVRLGGDL